MGGGSQHRGQVASQLDPELALLRYQDNPVNHNYRREDTAGYVGRLSDTLAKELGPRAVFRDIDGIKPGDNFHNAIARTLSDTTVLLAAIGRRWLTVTDDDGKVRLFEDNDLVRLEIEEALKRKIRVIPVLIDGAKPLKRSDLPTSIQELADIHAVRLDDDRWSNDVEFLLTHLPKDARRFPELNLLSRLKAQWWWPLTIIITTWIWLAVAWSAAPKYSEHDGLSTYLLHGVTGWAIAFVIFALVFRATAARTPWLKFFLLGGSSTALVWAALAQGAQEGAWVAAAVSAAGTSGLLRYVQHHSVRQVLNTYRKTLTDAQWISALAAWCVFATIAETDTVRGTLLLDVVVEVGVTIILVLGGVGFAYWLGQSPRARRDLMLPIACVVALWLFWGGLSGQVRRRQEPVPNVRVSAADKTSRTNENGFFTLWTSSPFGEHTVRVEHPNYTPVKRYAFLVPLLRTTLTVTSLETIGEEATISSVEPPWPLSSRAIRGVFEGLF